MKTDTITVTEEGTTFELAIPEETLEFDQGADPKYENALYIVCNGERIYM